MNRSDTGYLRHGTSFSHNDMAGVSVSDPYQGYPVQPQPQFSATHITRLPSYQEAENGSHLASPSTLPGDDYSLWVYSQAGDFNYPLQPSVDHFISDDRNQSIIPTPSPPAMPVEPVPATRRTRRSKKSQVRNPFPETDPNHMILASLLRVASSRNVAVVDDDLKRFLYHTGHKTYQCPLPDCGQEYLRKDR